MGSALARQCRPPPQAVVDGLGDRATIHDHGALGSEPDMQRAATAGRASGSGQRQGHHQHRDIKNLDMPGMTMVFTAKDKSMLTNLKPGDKVKFMVISDGGKLVVTEIQPVR